MASADSTSSFSDFSLHSDLENLDIRESDISVSPVSTPRTSDLSSSDDEPINSVIWHSRYFQEIPITPFIQPSGPTKALGPQAREIDFFTLFLDDELVELVVMETNRYAEYCIASHPDPKWQPTTIPEIKAYFGMMVAMSIMNIPSYTIAWGSSKLFSLPGIAEIMTKNRFEKITKYLHLNDKTGQLQRGNPDHDKLYLVRPVLEKVRKKCLENYNPPRDQSIDEAMVAYRGRLSFRQYIPAKPTKFGIKVWMRSSSSSGYCHDFQVYTGRDVRGVPETGLGGRVVLDLAEPLYGKHHHLYMDSYFSSPTLFEQLHAQGLYACGTVRTNRRGLPSGMKNTGHLQEQGEAKLWQKGPMGACVWKDKKPVAFLYTNTQVDSRTTVMRKQKDGTRKEITCPLVCARYNANMAGVDRSDQLRAQYSTTRKAKKWWRYLFWFLFDICVVNSFLCMRESANHVLQTRTKRERKRTQLEFRINLAEQLIGQYRGPRKRKIPPTVDQHGQGHWPVWSQKRGRCRLCSEQKKRHEVHVECTSCKLHLCIDNNCFFLYHQRLARRGDADMHL